MLLRTAALFRPHRAGLVTLAVLTVLGVGLELSPVLLIRRMVETATSGSPPDAAAKQGMFRELNLLFLGLLALTGAGAAVGMTRAYLDQTIGQGVVYHIRRDVHEHLQRLPLRFFVSSRTGEILSRLSLDVNAAQEAISKTLSELLRSGVTVLVGFALMFAMDWRLALLTLALLPIWIYPTIRVGAVQKNLTREYHEGMGQMSSRLADTLSAPGTMLVKALGRQEEEAARLDDVNRRLRDLSIRRRLVSRWFAASGQLFATIGPGLVYWYGGRSVLNQSLSIGTVVAFAVLTQRVFTPFARVMQGKTLVLSSLALFERFYEYLDLPVELEESPDARDLREIRGALELDAVTFRYGPDTDPALRDVSFTVEPGQRVALVGPSGAGKSTVTLLLQRFYDPQSGSVRLDGHDIRELTLSTISRAFGTVTQDPHLFHATLRENICYGLDADSLLPEALTSAVRTAGLEELVERLPEGLETVVGERGARLSGGEKDRVALARIVLRDPPVLILDEATSSLDQRMEREIRRALKQQMEKRTTIVIAHRIQTAADADQILVLDQGLIFERGTHAQLLERRGLYAQLVRAGESAEAV